MRPRPSLLTALGSALALTVALGAVPPAPAAAQASSVTLTAGHALIAGTARSTLHNGWYSLETTSGTVTLWEAIPVPGADGPTTSTTGTWFRADPTGMFQADHDHSELRLRPNGDLELLTSHGRRLWHSGTRGSGAVRLTLHRNGLLALHAKSGRIVWSSQSGQEQMSGGMSLRPGQRLRSAWETAFPKGGPTTLTMQRNGNLVYRCGSEVAWQSGTHVPGSTLRMYRTGVLRVETPQGRVVWSSGRHGKHDYAYFVSSNMMIRADGIELVWYAQTNWRVC